MNDEDLLDLYELDDEIRGFPRIKNVPLPTEPPGPAYVAQTARSVCSDRRG